MIKIFSAQYQQDDNLILSASVVSKETTESIFLMTIKKNYG